MSTKLRELREKRDALVEKQVKEYKALSEMDHGNDAHTAARDSVRKITAEVNDLSQTIDVMAGAEEAARKQTVADAKREEVATRSGKSDPWLSSMVDPNTNEVPDFPTLARKMLAASKGQTTMHVGGDMRAVTRKAVHTTTAADNAGQVPEYTVQPGYYPIAQEDPEVIDVIPQGVTEQSTVAYTEETEYDNNAQERNENAAYPESNYKREKKTSPVRLIGHRVTVTDEELEDVPVFESYLRGNLTDGIRRRLNTQIIKGNGTAPNLAGIVGHTYTPAILTIAQPAANSSTALAIHSAMAKVRAEGFRRPTHVFIHPTDWDRVRTSEYSGIFPFGPPTAAGIERLWGMTVVQTTDLTVKTALVGVMAEDSIALYVRRGIEVQTGYNEDDLEMGRITIRAGARYALVIRRPRSFSTVTALK